MHLDRTDIRDLFARLTDREIREHKETLIGRLNGSRADFDAAVEIALSGERPRNWHAAWIIRHGMSANDERLRSHVGRIVESIHGGIDGFQCELLRILERLEIPADLEAPLFDVCLDVWRDVDKSPGVRMFAFRQICRITDQYPELKSEVRLVITQEYLAPLSPGIGKTVKRLIEKHDLEHNP